MKRILGVAVLGVLAGCGGGGDGSSAPTTASSTTVTLTPGPSTSAPGGTLRAWLAAGQGWLTDLSTAAERLRNLAPDSPGNAGILVGLADGARQAASGFRTLPPPSTGLAESGALVGTLDGLDVAARSASTCTSECGPVYTTVLAAQEAFTEALRRAVATAQAGG